MCPCYFTLTSVSFFLFFFFEFKEITLYNAHFLNHSLLGNTPPKGGPVL